MNWAAQNVYKNFSVAGNKVTADRIWATGLNFAHPWYTRAQVHSDECKACTLVVETVPYKTAVHPIDSVYWCDPRFDHGLPHAISACI